MSKGQQQSQSAFKQLYTEMFNQGGDFSKVGKDLKKPIKCYVKESFPHFLVSDGYFFVPVYFTKDAVSEFKKSFSNVNISDLEGRVIVLNNWALEMKRVNSAEVFTSYANLEVRLIVSSFKPNLQEKLQPNRYPTNLFRDDEIKTIIQHFRHQAIQVIYLKNLNNYYREQLPRVAKVNHFPILPSYQLPKLAKSKRSKRRVLSVSRVALARRMMTSLISPLKKETPMS